MKFVVLAIVMAFSSAAFAGLPKEYGQRKVELPVARAGKTVRVNFAAVLPKTQKLNPSSYFAVYEKTGSEWTEVKKFKLAEGYSTNDVYEVNEDIPLSSENSEIALHTTLYHCGKTKSTACYIQAFQGQTARSAEGKTHLDFVAKATVEDLSGGKH